MVNDLVEVPVNDKFTGRREYKIATVKYVSAPGERSTYAWATVIRRLPHLPPPPSPSPPEARKIIVEKPVYVPQPVVREVEKIRIVEKSIYVQPQSSVQNISPGKVSPLTPEQLRQNLLNSEEYPTYPTIDPPQQPTRVISSPSPKPNYPKTDSVSSSKQFVQVIFKKNSKKRFDYLLGDNNNIRVGDFVVVHVNHSGKTTWKIAKVMYISSPEEVSLYAKSPVIKKADYPKW